MAVRVCESEGCEQPHASRGWCQKHYYENVKRPKFEAATDPCSLDGCDRHARTRGLCDMHYQRMRKTGSPEAVAKARRVGVAPCSVNGCEAVVKAHGVCALHLHRLYRHGAPTARVRAEVVNGRRICPGCKQDVPLDDWVQNGGKYRSCRPCFLAEYRDRNHLRRVRLLGGEVEKFAAVEVFERDGWICQLCMEPIDREAKWPERLSASLDHRIPVSRGGGHTRANTQASHLTCNLRKHAKMPDIEEAA